MSVWPGSARTELFRTQYPIPQINMARPATIMLATTPAVGRAFGAAFFGGQLTSGVDFEQAVANKAADMLDAESKLTFAAQGLVFGREALLAVIRQLSIPAKKSGPFT